MCAGALRLWCGARSSPLPRGLLRELAVSEIDSERAAHLLEPARSLVEEIDGPGRVRQCLVEGSSHQSATGLFYTPFRVAKAMAELVRREAPQGRIIDPAAGSGVFGLALIDRGDDVVLVEKDRLGAAIAAACTGTEALRSGACAPRVWSADALGFDTPVDMTAAVWGSPRRRLDRNGPFAAAIGNPPYGRVTGRPAPEPALGRPPNVAAAFTLRYLDRLSSGGVLAFLLPRSLEFVQSWDEFRHALARRGDLIGICPLGREIDVGMEQTVVAIRRSKTPKSLPLPVLRFRDDSLIPDYLVPATELDRPDRPIAWFLSPECLSILEKVETKSKPLSAWSPKICRGVTVQRHLEPGGRGRRWITRSDIERYRVTGSRSLSATAPETLVRRVSRLRRPKIVAQRRVTRRAGPPSRIVLKAAYDPDGRFDPADTVVNVMLADPDDALLALAVMNTELASYYLLARSFNGNAQTTPDLDRSYLERLFIPDLPAGERRLLIRLARRATEAALSGEEATVGAEVEARLASHFGLTRADQSVVLGRPP